MTVHEKQQKARLILSKCMVEVLRPHSEKDHGLPVNERLVGYAIASGIYGGQPVGVNKLAEMTGLPKSTVRSVLMSIGRRGWIVRRPDKTYDFSDEFHENADDWFGLVTKYQAIVRAADALRLLDGISL